MSKVNGGYVNTSHSALNTVGAVRSRPVRGTQRLQPTREVRETSSSQSGGGILRSRALSALTGVTEKDVEAFTRHTPDELISELSRIMASVGRISQRDRDDESAALMTMMLDESIRRMMIVKAAQGGNVDNAARGNSKWL